jgi:hypothetical protein
MDICHKRFVASIACSWLSQSTWSNWADDHIASFLILSRSAEECTFEWMLRSRLDTKWQPVISGSAIEVGGSRGIVIGFGSPVGLGWLTTASCTVFWWLYAKLLEPCLSWHKTWFIKLMSTSSY